MIKLSPASMYLTGLIVEKLVEAAMLETQASILSYDGFAQDRSYSDGMFMRQAAVDSIRAADTLLEKAQDWANVIARHNGSRLASELLSRLDRGGKFTRIDDGYRFELWVDPARDLYPVFEDHGFQIRSSFVVGNERAVVIDARFCPWFEG